MILVCVALASNGIGRVISNVDSPVTRRGFIRVKFGWIMGHVVCRS